MRILWCYVPEESSSGFVRIFDFLERDGHAVFALNVFSSSLAQYEVPKNFIDASNIAEIECIDMRDKWCPRIAATSWDGDPNAIYDELQTEAQSILSTLKPSIVVAWNALAPNFGILADVATVNGIKVLHSDRGIIPKSVYIDRRGTLNLSSKGNSDSACIRNQVTEEMRCRGAAIIQQINKSSVVRHRHIPRHQRRVQRLLKRSSFKKVMTVFGGPLGEMGYAGAVPHKNEGVFPLFPSYSELFWTLSRSFPDVLWLFKPHPHAGQCDVDESKNVRLTRANPSFLIDHSDACFFHGSKLEVEAAAREKVVVLLGYGQLWNKGICQDVNSVAELLDVVEGLNAGGNVPSSCLENLEIYLGWLSDKYFFTVDPTSNIPDFMNFDVMRAQVEKYFPKESEQCSLVPYEAIRVHRNALVEERRKLSTMKSFDRLSKKLLMALVRRLLAEKRLS